MKEIKDLFKVTGINPRLLVQCLWITALVFFFHFSVAGSPETDSLEIKLVLSENKEKPIILNKLADLYLKENPAIALQKAQLAWTLARKESLPKQEAKALLNLGRSEARLNNDSEAALNYCFEALTLFTSMQLHQEMINTLFWIGQIYYGSGDFQQAIEHLMEASHEATKIKDIRWLARISQELGVALSAVGLHDEAMSVLKNSLKYFRQLNNIRQIAETLDRLAQVYLAQEDFYHAYLNQNEALRIRKTLDSRDDIAASFYGLGHIYFKQSKLDSAYFYYRQTLNIVVKSDNHLLLARTLNGLGAIFLNYGEYERALNYLKEAELVAQIAGAVPMKRTFEMIFECYFSLRDYKNALIYKELFADINDFIFKENSQKTIGPQARYAIDEKERDLEILKKDIDNQNLAFEKQKDFKNFLVILSLLLGIIIVMYIIILRNKMQHNHQLQEINQKVVEQNGQLKELNATKDRFFSIIGHDLRSPLNSLSSFSDLLINHTNTLKPEEIKMVASNLSKSVKNLNNLLENLLMWSRSQSAGITIKKENVPIIKIVEENFLLFETIAANKKIKLSNQLPVDLYGYCDFNTTNTIMRNLLANALKFTGESGEVKVTGSSKNNYIEISVVDSGTGMDSETIANLFKIDKKQSAPGTANEKGTGLGLFLCKDFAEKNGGELTVSSELGKGSCFTFTLPQATIKEAMEAAMF